MIRVVHPETRNRMLTFSHPGSLIQGSKRHPISDPGSGSATLLITTPHGSVQSSFTILRLLCFQCRSRDIDLDPIEIIFACWWTPSARQSYFFLTLQALKTFEMDTIPCGLTGSDQDPDQNPICSNITKLPGWDRIRVSSREQMDDIYFIYLRNVYKRQRKTIHVCLTPTTPRPPNPPCLEGWN